jgi:radical SAM superfamily enzyme YgiQ (UPF0313 family)
MRIRSVNNVMNELIDAIKHLSPKVLSICDSNFMPASQSRRKWLLEFFTNIHDKQLSLQIRANTRANDILFYIDNLDYFKQYGLTSLFIGIESFIQRQLDLYNKKVTVDENIRSLKLLATLGFKIEIGFIFLEPYVTLNEIYDIMKENGLEGLAWTLSWRTLVSVWGLGTCSRWMASRWTGKFSAMTCG